MTDLVTDLDRLKRDAARSAVGAVESGMVLGLGTGSTILHFLDALAERLHEGEIADVTGVPTSVRTADRCAELGIPLTTLSQCPTLDLAVDGADEVDPELRLIKGLGGALLREKMVAQAARRFIVIADDSKRVRRLGTRSPLPIEVVAFEWRSHLPFLEALGGRAVLRGGSSPYHTDNGNLVLDCSFEGGIESPDSLDRALLDRAGIVEHGLFLGLATEARLAGEDGIITLARDSQ